MRLSLSVRIAESMTDKTRLATPFEEIVRLAAEIGYDALCMRASVVSVSSEPAEVAAVARAVRDRGLKVSMVTGDVSLAANDERAGEALRDIGPYLDLAAALGSRRVRVMIRRAEEIEWARRAADRARERDILLCHQTHTQTLLETVDECLEVVERVGRPNFGVTYEPANLLACGDDYGPAQIRRLGPRILNVYLQNYRVGPGGTMRIATNRGAVPMTPIPLDEPGGVALERVFAGLRAIEYDGWVTVHSALVPGLTVEESARRYHAALAPYVA